VAAKVRPLVPRRHHEGRNREVRKLFDTSVDGQPPESASATAPWCCRRLKRGVWVDLDEADVRTIPPAGHGNNSNNNVAGKAA